MYQKTASGWLKHFDFIILDVLCLQLAFLAAYMLRHGMSNPYENVLYRNLAFVFCFINLGVTFFSESLKNVLKRGYYKEFISTLTQDAWIILISAFYLFVIQESGEYSRLTFGITGVLYLCFSYGVRISWKHFLKSGKREDKNKRSLVIVTSEEMLREIQKDIKAHLYEEYRIMGIVSVSSRRRRETLLGIPVKSLNAATMEWLQREWVDEVFINISDDFPFPGEVIDQFMEMGITVHMKLAKSSNLKGQKQFVEKIGNYSVLTTSVNVASARQLFMKRFLDICGGLAGCIITGILFLILGPMIHRKSPGPIFFSQIRVGKGGRRFKIYKFRSMYLDAEERKKELMEQNRIKDGMMFKMEYDPRIIGSEKGQGKGIGNFIRKYSLDEFPQFFNVLKGDMSLVGTRPPTVDEWEKYELHHRARLAIKPGITGMWQVSGRSEITDFEEVVELDKKYIMEWNFGLDFKILFRTVLVVFRKDGAA